MKKLSVPHKYIGIPFVENQTDCLHIARSFVENELDVRVTQLPPDINAAQKQHERYRSLVEDIPFASLIPGDIVFFGFPQRWHCGVYLGYGEMLHTVKPFLAGARGYSCISRITTRLKNCYLGAIRTAGKTEIVVPDAGETLTLGQVIYFVYFIYSIYSAVTSYISSGSGKKKIQGGGGNAGSPKYDFDAIRNTRSNQLIYPVHIGRNKYGGNIFWEKSDPDGTVHRFIMLGVGLINSVSDVRVNDIAIADLPGCSYTAYLGTPGQTVDSRAAGTVYGLRNRAYLAVTLAPSDKLPGGDPVVTAWYEGSLMPTWDGSAWGGSSYSRNPAAAVRYILALSREDGGPQVPTAEIDSESFGEVYDYFAALIDDGAGGTHARAQMDFIFDEERPLLDVLRDIMLEYGMYFIVTDKIYLHVLKEESAVYAFTEDNIDADSFKYWETSKNDRFNEVLVKYADPDQNDVAVEVKALDAYDQALTGSIRSGEYSFLGINRFAEAARRAEFIKNETNVNFTMCELRGGIETIQLTIGDVVTVTHSLPGWTTKPFRIQNITESEQSRRVFVLKEETPSVYNDGMSSVIERYDYGTPPNAYAPVTDVAGLVVSESAYYRHKDGTVGSDILVSWSAPADASRQFLRHYQVELKKGSGDYKTIGSTAATAFIVYSVEDEETYYVRIKTVSINEVTSSGTASAALTIIGKDQPPSNITGFEVFQEGNLLHFVWDAVPDPDLSRYIIKKGADWNTAETIGEKVDSTEFVYPVGEIGNITFLVKAEDRSENQSLSPAVDTITVTAPPDMNFVNNYDPWMFNREWILSNVELVYRNDFNAGYVRPVFALRTAVTWEEREVEAQTWEYQEVNSGLELNGTVEASGYFQMSRPIDLEAIFEFKLVIDADYVNVTGGSLEVQISTSEDGATYTAFATVSASTLYRARYIKLKFILATTDTAFNVFFYGCTIYVTAPVTRTAWLRDVAIPITGKTIIFDAGFTAAPRVTVTVVNGVIGFPVVNNKTPEQCDVLVYDPAGNAIGTAEVDIDCKGY